MQVVDLPMKEIYSDDDFNCRGSIAPMDVIDLARSIDHNGLQQPIVVQPYDQAPYKYKIVSGHRRFLAFKVNRAEVIPCFIREGLTEMQARVLNLEENLKRKDLNMLQEALALQPFRNYGMTQADLAKEIGMSTGWINIRLMILDFVKPIQQEIAAGFLTQEQIKDIHGLKPDEQLKAVKRVKEAKESGEKITQRLNPPKKKPFQKKVRDRGEVFQMQDHIQDAIGNNIGTRCLAWCAGEISDAELHQTIKEYAEEKGINYHIPVDVLAAL